MSNVSLPAATQTPVTPTTETPKEFPSPLKKWPEGSGFYWLIFRGGAQLTIARVTELEEGNYVFNTVRFEDLYLNNHNYNTKDTAEGGIFENPLWQKIPDAAIKQAEEIFDNKVKDKRIAELEQQVRNLQAAIDVIKSSKHEVAQPIVLESESESESPSGIPISEVRSH